MSQATKLLTGGSLPWGFTRAACPFLTSIGKVSYLPLDGRIAAEPIRGNAFAAPSVPLDNSSSRGE